MGWLAREDVGKDRTAVRMWHSMSGSISLLSVPVAIPAGILVSLGLNLHVGELLLTVVLFMSAAASASRSVGGNILISLGYQADYGTAHLLSSLFVLLGIVSAYLSGILDLGVALGVNVVALLVQNIIIAKNLRRRIGRVSIAPVKSVFRFVRQIAPRAARSWRGQLLEAFSARTDTVIIATHGTTVQVGYYSVVALIPQIASQIYSTLIQHSFSKNPSLDRRERSKLLWQVCNLLAVPLALISIPAGSLVIPWIFGEAYREAGEFLVSGAAMVLGLAGIVPTLQDAAHRRRGGNMMALGIGIVFGLASFAVILVPLNIAVAILGILLAVVSAGYVALTSGVSAFRVSSDILRLFGRHEP